MSQSAFDFGYLETFTAGDRQVIAEVLALFLGQAEGWAVRLADPGEGWRDLVHTMKGSARGIGATVLGDVCDRAERGDAAMAPEVRAALDAAVLAVRAYLDRSGG